MNAESPTTLAQQRPLMSYNEYIQMGRHHVVANGEVIPRNESINKHVFAWAERIYLGKHGAYKKAVSEAMRLAIDKSDHAKGIQSGKTEKLDALRKIREQYDAKPDAYPSFNAAHIQCFEKEAQIKRNTRIPKWMRREPTSQEEFKKQLNALKNESTLPTKGEASQAIHHNDIH